MRREVGEDVATGLYRVEAAIDAALAETAAFLASLPRARSAAYLSATAGQRVFEHAAQSLTALVDARSQMVTTHRTLATLARGLGLDALAVGPLDKPEDTPPIGGGPKVESDANP